MLFKKHAGCCLGGRISDLKSGKQRYIISNPSNTSDILYKTTGLLSLLKLPTWFAIEGRLSAYYLTRKKTTENQAQK
jgi:hypothetical protein